MNNVIAEKKSINTFVEHLLTKKIRLNPETMADEFLSFFSDQDPPTTHDDIEFFCSEIGINEVQYSSSLENMRGFHLITPDKKIIITFEKSGYGGKVHTLYHEIYEIVCELMDKQELKTERKANLFSANVIMPDWHFFEYAIRRGLMFNEIKIYYPEIATDSILLRINELFKKRGLLHVAYLLKNSNAYKRRPTEYYKYKAGFQLCFSTLDQINSINNEEFTKKIIDETLEKICQCPDDELSLIKFSRPKMIVLAEPILLDRGNSIKEIAIQILDDNTYQKLGKILRRNDERNPIRPSIF